jgi:hypothetical protein
VHCSQHTGDKLINSVTLLDERYQGRYPTLIVVSILEMREDQFLEGVDLILEVHEIHNGLVTVSVSLAINVFGGLDQTYPSFGSLIVFKLIYSSYSKRPVRRNSACIIMTRHDRN